jgi:hypothetical protein
MLNRPRFPCLHTHATVLFNALFSFLFQRFFILFCTRASLSLFDSLPRTTQVSSRKCV